ncbi:MAG: 2-C-methyl-D-erythritol 4-phosphate cytidylyltransferase [Rhodocyclaceae bacterium]|nr:2-C-methyl-D-erythritol 4-phosphate cytidylyltransferase [Rhodocyclaceae bacterium]MBX3667161.1 2-C-methyl-D-erythritol 4-phosphate cytidylyltransferase [Rhodocyclaceae bacterium]
MSRYFALLPAAGQGARMGAAMPKQYLPLAGQPLIRHSVRALCSAPRIERVFVVLAADDTHWGKYDWSEFGARLVPLFCGGASRALSVLAGLHALHAAPWSVAEGDWVLVHDAARACLAPHLLERLIEDLREDEIGGLLAMPVADTVKRASTSRRTAQTVPRDGLWLAQTPQMFRYGLLRRALAQYRDVTDEASAIEAAGLAPRLVESDVTNLKITFPLDLHLAELILRDREAT